MLVVGWLVGWWVGGWVGWWVGGWVGGWMGVGCEGSPPHIIAHTMHGAHAQVSIFVVSVFFSFLFHVLADMGIVFMMHLRAKCGEAVNESVDANVADLRNPVSELQLRSSPPCSLKVRREA